MCDEFGAFLNERLESAETERDALRAALDQQYEFTLRVKEGRDELLVERDALKAENERLRSFSETKGEVIESGHRLLLKAQKERDALRAALDLHTGGAEDLLHVSRESQDALYKERDALKERVEADEQAQWYSKTQEVLAMKVLLEERDLLKAQLEACDRESDADERDLNAYKAALVQETARVVSLDDTVLDLKTALEGALEDMKHRYGGDIAAARRMRQALAGLEEK